MPGASGALHDPAYSRHVDKVPAMKVDSDAWSDRSRALAADLSRTALGDRAAFARLYDASRSHLFGVILRIQRDRAQAEDILQDVFVNVWRAAASFDATRSQPLTWLTTIARHRAIDSLRRQQTEPNTVSLHVETDDGESRSLLDQQPAADADPLHLLQRSADAQGLNHCVGELTPVQQQCLALAFYQGLSHSEVALHLAQPMGTVKSWLRRALASLKDCLGRAGQAAGVN